MFYSTLHSHLNHICNYCKLCIHLQLIQLNTTQIASQTNNKFINKCRLIPPVEIMPSHHPNTILQRLHKSSYSKSKKMWTYKHCSQLTENPDKKRRKKQRVNSKKYLSCFISYHHNIHNTFSF